MYSSCCMRVSYPLKFSFAKTLINTAIFEFTVDRASSLMCHQCQSSKDAIDHDCLTSSPNALKRCPENEEYCVIIEEFTKNSK